VNCSLSSAVSVAVGTFAGSYGVLDWPSQGSVPVFTRPAPQPLRPRRQGREGRELIPSSSTDTYPSPSYARLAVWRWL